MKTWIKNATIVDGTGNHRYKGSIEIEKEKILAIHREMHELTIDKEDIVIDATGLICSPGFIDTHSHSDLKVLSAPQLLPKILQGITTEVLGQDGISMAPLPIEYIDPWKKNLAGLDGEDENLDWTYVTTQEYLNRIEKVKPALNEAYLLPHGNVRMEAMGLSSDKASRKDIEKMCEITRREMKSGCVGLSSGLIYMPCAYSHTEEIIEMCKVIKEFNGVFVVHQRSEADAILPSMDEIIRIGKESGVDIHFSHFKVCGKKNWDKLPFMFNKLDEAKAAGIHVSLDQYPYVAGSTMLGVILPPWVHDGGTSELLKRLARKEDREKIKKDMKEGILGWDNFIEFAGTEGIFITSVNSANNQKVIGLNLDQLGQARGKDPLEAAFDLLLEENNAVGMVDFYGTEDHVKAIMLRSEMNLCTDGLLSGKPHPRAFGSFPRLLGKYVREEKIMSLEQAINKMTKKAADALRIQKRGVIKEGYFADLSIFDEQTIMDRGTFEQPSQYPMGLQYVIVNGKIAVDQGRATDNRSGMVIRMNQKEQNDESE